MNWVLDLLTTCTHHPELHVIIALSLICTLYSSLHHTLIIFQPAVFTSPSLTTASNSGDFSASRTQVISSPTLVQTYSSQPQLHSTLNSQSFFQLACVPLYIASGRTQQKTPFPAITLLLLAHSLQRDLVYRTIAWQWTSPLAPLFRPSGVMSQY
jgi:hypothetical protein